MSREDWDYGGLDLSLTNTGLCRYRVDGSYETLSIGEERLSKLRGQERIRRLMAVARKIVDFVEDCGSVCVEEYFVARAGMSTVVLGELGALVRRELCEMDIRFVEVPPASLKKWIAGKGNANKTEMALALYKRWKLEFSNDDEADAYGLCRIMECLDGVTECTNNAQRDALKALQ